MINWVAANRPEVMQFVAAPTIVMAQDLYQWIQELQPQSNPRSILFLAVFAGGTQIEDHGSKFLHTIADEIIVEDVPLLRLLDAIIDLLHVAEHNASRAHRGQQATGLRLWLRWFLSQRQLLVDVQVYTVILQKQEAACKKLRLVVTNVSNFVKIQAEKS